MIRLATMLLLLAPALPAQAKEPPAAVVVQQLLQTQQASNGKKLDLPPDASLTVSTYSFRPGAVLPAHKHLHPRYAYVLEGTIRVTSTESGRSEVYKRGDFIVEMIDEWHRGTALGTAPVKLLVIDQVPAGTTGNVVLQK